MRKGNFSEELPLSLRKIQTSSTNPMPGVPQTATQGIRTEQKIKVQLYMVPVGIAGPVLFLDT